MYLKEALEKQINFCMNIPSYRCGIFVKDYKRGTYIMDGIKDSISLISDNVESVRNGNEKVICFKNGSCIKILSVNNCNTIRGQKFNGAIIDNDSNMEVAHCIIYPMLRPMFNDETQEFEPFQNVRDRVYFVFIMW